VRGGHDASQPHAGHDHGNQGASSGTYGPLPAPPAGDAHDLSEQSRAPADWGIEVVAVRYSAEGYVLDFRYRVLDPHKAAPLFKRQIKPYLIDEKTGARMGVPSPPKTGPLRSSNPPLADRTYFMFFANAGRLVQPGSTVTIVIGDFRVKAIVEQ